MLKKVEVLARVREDGWLVLTAGEDEIAYANPDPENIKIGARILIEQAAGFSEFQVFKAAAEVLGWDK